MSLYKAAEAGEKAEERRKPYEKWVKKVTGEKEGEK